ncbi:MAG TPA: hypothetical protein VFA71_05525 [Terriglobales bacterium]|nr:hypothetical protein [Terriglobales bacterium]
MSDSDLQTHDCEGEAGRMKAKVAASFAGLPAMSGTYQSYA